MEVNEVFMSVDVVGLGPTFLSQPIQHMRHLYRIYCLTTFTWNGGLTSNSILSSEPEALHAQ